MDRGYHQVYFIMVRKWEQPICPSTNEWVMKTRYMYTMNFYSAVKKMEIMKLVGKKMEPEYIL